MANEFTVLAADHYGDFAVGIIVVSTGIGVEKESSEKLSDVMPHPELLDQLRQTALAIPGVAGLERLFARSTGLQDHVDLHLEVDPGMTVVRAHDLATQVRFTIRETIPWVADVLVHAEPAPKMMNFAAGQKR